MRNVECGMEDLVAAGFSLRSTKCGMRNKGSTQSEEETKEKCRMGNVDCGIKDQSNVKEKQKKNAECRMRIAE